MKRRVLSFIMVLALCLELCPAWGYAADAEAGDGLCPHHPAHTDACGCVPGAPGAPCTFACRICPLEDLIGRLPDSVSPDNSEQVQAQLNEILALYGELAEDEQQQVDISPCLSLWEQLEGTEAAALSNDNLITSLTKDETITQPWEIPAAIVFNTNGYTLEATGTSAFIVTSTGKLTIIGGGLIYSWNTGVTVEAGGSLYITEAKPNISIQGQVYALDIASGAKVQLSSGTYSSVDTGGIAIHTADGKYAALLVPGYAYFDQNGTPIPLTDMKTATNVTVKQCTEHLKQNCLPVAKTTRHSWTCPYCNTTESEPCTFTFNETTTGGTGTCNHCSNTLTIAIDESNLGDLIYNSTDQTANVTLTVKLGDGTELTNDTDYTVTHTTRVDVGEITVTVTGKTFNGTFTKTYQVEQDQPGIEWDETTKTLAYDGTRATIKEELPHITITIKDPNNEDLHPYLRYSYRKASDTNADFTSGLPLDAGTYVVKAYLPESQNYKAAETDPLLTLTINKIDPVTAHPIATTPTYNRTAQAIVTAGTLDGRATGAKILFKRDPNGEYTETIPTETNAGNYEVWYKVDGTDNYNAVGPTKITAPIAPKRITPTVELSQSSYLYNGTKKEPVITVKDGDTVIEKAQYTVTWAKDGDSSVTDADMLKAAGTYTATIQNVPNGNYSFTATAKVEIVAASQNGLAITNKRDHVYYGDVFTLGTSGGTGNGTVKWSITAGESSAEIDESTGVLTVKGTGSVTVKAERIVPNYGTVSDAWTFTVEPKQVVADVTVTSKPYDGTTTAIVTAAVKVGDLVASSDSFTLANLTGTYDTANVGTGKTVTLNDTNATKADGSGKYTISYPATATGDITPKDVAVTVTLSGNDLQTDNTATPPAYSYNYDGTEKTPTVTVTANDGAVLKATDYSVEYSNNKNVGTATVTVTKKAGGNYTFPNAMVNYTIKSTAAVLTKTPEAKTLTYTGQPQELVTVGTATGGQIKYKLTSAPTGEPTPDSNFSTNIPTGTNAGTYTVDYKVVGDDNHMDGPTGSVTVTIQPKTVISPQITVTGAYDYTYSGSAKTPAVTVVDGTTTIPDTEYTLSYRDNINAGAATVIVADNNGGNYTVNGTATFEIVKAAATVGTAPTGKTGLHYNGGAQELLATKGTATGGTLVYSLSEPGEYSAAIPTGKAVGEYEIWYKVQGDANHSDTTPAKLADKVEIAKNTVTNPTIQVTPQSVKYTGEKQTPTVTAKDDSGLLIDGSEYEVTYKDTTNNNTDLTAVGTYTVTVTGVTNGNYIFNTTKTATFTITPADQTPLAITGTRERVYYGDKIQLGTTGGNGTVTWAVSDDSIAGITNGLLTIKGVGSVTVTATSTDGNYKPQTAAWNLYAEKKPVTALVTAASKTYNGNADAAVTATLQTSDFVGTDSFTITLTGCTFEDPNAGTDKKVNVVSTNPTFTPGTGNHENYAITYPATATASIFKANIDIKDTTKVTAPTVATGPLTYTGLPLTLVETAGTATCGTMEYSVDGANYSTSLPTGTDAGDYDVWYRVKGDGNHKDTVGTKLTSDTDKVTIAQQTVTDPFIEFNPSGATYDGQEHKPAVTLKDNAHGRVIPASEYTVDYGSTNWKDEGNHTVTITGKTDGNYSITGTPTKAFTILPAGQSPLSIVGQPGEVRYGDVFTLSANGGSGTGAVTWETSDGTVAEVNSQTGRVKILKSGGPVTITARKAAGGGYAETTATWTFSAEKRPAKAIVTARNKPYDTNTTATLDVTWKDGDLLGGDSITLSLTGAFDDANVGTDKIVRITRNGDLPDGGGKYAVTYNTTTTASITAPAAKVSGVNAGPWTYSGSEISLLQGGAATNGTIVYSRNGVDFMETSPTERNAGKYTVYYKARGNTNYADSEARMVEVTIQPKTVTLAATDIELSLDTFGYDGTAKEPDVVRVLDGSTVIPASEYTVSYRNNISVGTATVTITDVTGGNYTVSGSKTFTITAGAPALKEAPRANNLTYTGKPQVLVTAGSAVNGTVMYSLDGGEYSATIPRATDAGDYEVAYKVVGENNDATTEDYVYVTINPKTVTPLLTLSSNSLTYTGSALTPTVTVSVNSQPLTQGIDYTVTYSNNTEPGTATVTVTSIGGNYQFTAQTTFTITKAKAAFQVEPTANTDLVYTGQELELLNFRGMTADGIPLFSTDGTTYSMQTPTGIKRGTYYVIAKVQGDSTHADSDRVVIGPITIAKNDKGATVTLESESTNFPYTGSAQRPPVTVLDSEGNVIDSSEYTVSYSDNINVGTATVTATSKSSGNYSFTATAEFQIVDASQTPLTITGKQDAVYYGDTLSLSTTGGGSGTVTWSSSNTTIANIDANGTIQKIGTSGSVTITAAKGGSTDTWTFVAKPKPVTATVYAVDKIYDGNNTATLTVTLSGLISGDSVTLTANGSFIDEKVGTNKTVLISGLNGLDGIQDKYTVSHNSTTTASITPKPASVITAPTLVTGPLTYNGNAQPLLSNEGTAVDGNMVYSLDGRDYTDTIPTGTDAKTYTVWYKVKATDDNHKDSTPVKLGTVTISPNTDSSVYIPPATPSSIFTAPVSTPAPVSATPSAPIQATVENGAASTVVSGAAGDKLVREAVEAQSESIVIKPEIDGEVTKAQVSIPASTVNQIASETNASLTVSAPMADVTIPQAALETLGGAGGGIEVVTEQVDQALVLTLTADGEKVESVPGGVTLTVPAEDAGPGTVAVLVHEDGAREVIPKSVAEDGKVSIPLDGSATVEIVDNGKAFDDVPAESWEADAAAFVSARELFGGTSETAFSPDELLSRGMLAEVLYRLEGSPEQEAASGFTDVDGDAWYANGVAWAAEQGIALGDGDGQFRPKEGVTREQFAVMLWKYAGSPEAESDQALDFTDAANVSDYAVEALRWAVEKGIMGGTDDHRLIPEKEATRIEAAQMLKNFLENT